MTLLHLFALSALAAFGPSLPIQPQQSAPDSAGVRVVTSRPTDVAADAWRIASTPDVEIGVVDGRPEYQLDRVSAAVFLSNGTIVVANGGTRELRFYDAAGRHIRSVGREGQGPGEFQSLTLAGAFAGDSLLVWDLVARRLTVFDSQGRLARTVQASQELGPAITTAGVLANGQLVALRRVVPVMSADVPNGIARPKGTVVTLAANGAVAATIGEFPDTELSNFERLSFGVIFGRTLHYRGRGDRIAVGNTDAYSIRVYSSAGRLLHVVRQPREPRAVTAEDYERARPTFPTTPVGARMRGAVDQMRRPSAYPSFGEFRIDDQGNLWVQEFAREWDERLVWQVFDAQGRFVGKLSVPASHTLLDATQTHAVFRVVDDLGVQRVRVYRIEKR